MNILLLSADGNYEVRYKSNVLIYPYSCFRAIILVIILASFLLQYKDQSCVTIYEDDTDSHKAGHWNDGDCIRELNYVCKGAASPDNPKPKSASCQKPGYENYSPYRDNCYWFSTVARTWSEAEKDCQSQGAHLMSVLDPSEQNFVFAHMHSEIIWIGLSGVKVKCFLFQ